ncbi:MAG: hypothetical protein BGN82_08595 [Alphaproteobacteria bacterium 65-7]|nr:MAG: hypothetical protein BGN82_08595 [Alphaproteobacteria bacterium 65-7]
MGGCTTPSDTPPPAIDLPASRIGHAGDHASPPPPAVRPVKRPRPASAARPKAVTLDPDRLIGLGPEAVRALLGPPAQVRDGDLSREWIYTARDCSFRVIFYPNLNAAAFRVLKYGGSNRDGDVLDVSDVCIRHILNMSQSASTAARKNDAAGNRRGARPGDGGGR